MDANEMLYKVRFYLDDMDAAKYQEVPLIMALNTAKNTVWDILTRKYPDRYLTQVEENAVADQEEYNIDSSWLMKELRRVKYTTSTGAETLYTVIDEADSENDFSTPVAYVRGDVLVLDPAPFESVTDGIVLTILPKLPNVYKDADDWEIPDSLADVIAVQAAIFVLATRGITLPSLEAILNQQMQIAIQGARPTKSSGGLKYSALHLRLTTSVYD